MLPLKKNFQLLEMDQDEILLGADEDELNFSCLNTDDFDSLLDDDHITANASHNQHVTLESASIAALKSPSQSGSSSVSKSKYRAASPSVQMSHGDSSERSVLATSNQSQNVVTTIPSSRKVHSLQPPSKFDSSLSQEQDDPNLDIGLPSSEASSPPHRSSLPWSYPPELSSPGRFSPGSVSPELPLSGSSTPHLLPTQATVLYSEAVVSSSQSPPSSCVTSMSPKSSRNSPAKKLIHLNGSSRFSAVPCQLPTVALPARAQKGRTKALHSKSSVRCPPIAEPTMFLDVSRDKFRRIQVEHSECISGSFMPVKKRFCAPNWKDEPHIDVSSNKQEVFDFQNRSRKTKFSFDYESCTYSCFDRAPLYQRRQQPAYTSVQQAPYGAVHHPPYSAMQQSSYGAVHHPPYSAMQQPIYGAVHHPPYSAMQQPIYGAVHPSYSAMQQPPYGAVHHPPYSAMQPPTYPDVRHPYPVTEHPPYPEVYHVYSVGHSEDQWAHQDELRAEQHWHEEEVSSYLPSYHCKPHSPSERPYHRHIEARSKSDLERRVTFGSKDPTSQDLVYLSRHVTFSLSHLK